MTSTNWRWYIISAVRFGDTYYLRSTGKLNGRPYHQWTEIEDDAATFSTLKDAQREAKTIEGAEIIEHFACPQCGGIISGAPAISRTDNTTRICTKCGIREAMEAFEKGSHQ
jgi:predicted RNA-binding Zn-ribbon protein involved in translation (DUF1610 family)